MLVLDTCALIFDALQPEKLSNRAARAIKHAEDAGQLACSDISLWEIAMLVQKKRVNPGTDSGTFLQLILDARKITVLPITSEIAAISVSHAGFSHFDPADRIIAAAALHHKARLVTSDKRLHAVPGLDIVW
jgi:PIN domain nuclease of toxin-antitoxin system